MRAEADTPFDLGRGPLLRVRLLKLGEREHILLCTFHHIIFDGWSSAVFYRDLSALYEAFRRGEESAPLKALPVQYADYALWQRERLEGEELERQLAYWKSQAGRCAGAGVADRLGASAAAELCRGAAFVGFGSGDCGSAQRAQPPGECHPFHDLAGGLSAAALPLQRPGGHLGGHSGSQSQPCRVGGAHRLLSGYLGAAHRFVGCSSFRELLRRVQKVTLEAYAHADVPLEKLVQELQPERSLNQTLSFQAFVNFLSFEDQAVRLAGLEAERCLKEA